jgi:hypothetical protein
MTHDSAGAYLNREVRSGAIGLVAARGYTPCYLPYLKLVYRDIRSAWYRQLQWRSYKNINVLDEFCVLAKLHGFLGLWNIPSFDGWHL